MEMTTLKKALQDHYGIDVLRLQPMEGYDSTNYKIIASDRNYVAKLYDATQGDQGEILAENRLMSLLSQSDLFSKKYEFSTPIASLDQGELVLIKSEQKWLRLLTYVEGNFLAQTDKNDGLLSSLGSFLGQIDLVLSEIRDPYIESRRLSWDHAHLLNNEHYISAIKDPSKRKLVAYFLVQWKTHVIDQLPFLRRQIVHNDANDHNVLEQNGLVSGLIDFGDMVYSYLINEVAVSAAYMAMGKEKPIEAITQMISAYHKVFPLQKNEIDLLYYFIATRLCTSVLNSAHSAAQKPDSAYITVSESDAWSLLEKWISINPIYAQQKWRVAIGLEIPEEQELQQQEEHLRQRRDQTMSKALSLSYRRPIHMKQAAFQYMYDASGHAILDAYNNIIQVGHCHPTVVRAGQKAMAELNTNTRYIYEALPRYTEHLLKYFPDHLDKVFLVNSGSAASDLATRLALTHTGREQMIVLEHGYHGNTQIGIDISHYKYGHKGGKGKKNKIFQTPLPDAYRGKYQGSDAGAKYANDLIKALSSKRVHDIAAFIAEPIVGCGGQVPLADGYLKEVYPHIRQMGGLCISDEVQTGFGRLGKWFWGFEMHDVQPDIVILGKPIGNGHPMAAVVTTSAIAESFDNGMEFFSSFGGNPVSCAIGDAVLQVIEDEGLQAHAHETGDYLIGLFKSMQSTYPCIGDIRGSGLFLGVDIVKDKDQKTPNEDLAIHIINSLREGHILTSLDGPYHNVIKVKPPLCFNKRDALILTRAIKNAIDGYI